MRTDKKLHIDVAQRTALCVAAAVVCTVTAVSFATIMGFLPTQRFQFELVISSIIAASVTTIVAPFVIWKILRLARELQQAKSELQKQVETDHLTKLTNRMGFENKANLLIEKAKNENKPVCFVMIDIDHFKQVNDKYGHQAGDEVIRSAAQAILKVSNRLSNYEIHVGRIGGEEFAISIRGLTQRRLVDFVENLRISCDREAVTFDGTQIHFTVSLGASISSHVDAEYESLMSSADHALYRAKRSGRNCAKYAEHPHLKIVA